MEKADFFLVGVGGQGILTAGDILARVGLQAGYDVKKSEAHGMSQRGGAVSTHVRFGRQVFSPLISQGEADFLLALEMLEALRWAHFLHPDGVALVDRQQIPPLAVTSGGAHYPDEEEVRRELSSRARRVIMVDGQRIARELGNPRVANTVLLGALAGFLPIPLSVWEAVVAERVPARYVAINQEAFRAGQAQVRSR